jgi:hypothetical protein
LNGDEKVVQGAGIRTFLAGKQCNGCEAATSLRNRENVNCGWSIGQKGRLYGDSENF